MKNGLMSRIVMVCLAVCTTLFATEANQFRLLSTLPQERVQDFAATGNYVYTLSAGNLTILDASTPGQNFTVVAAMPVDRNFVELAVSDRALALATRTGVIEIYQRNGKELANRSRIDLGDSVFAMQMSENQMCISQGYSGTRVIDISDLSNPISMMSLSESDYSAGLALTADFMYVLDRLNGVTVYSRSGGTYAFQDEILTELPPADISAAKFGVAICFGTGHFEYWFCSDFRPPQLQVSMTFELDINCLAANRSGLGTILLGDAGGEVVDYDPGHEIITARRNLGYPIEQLIISDGSSQSPYIVRDRIGNLTALSVDADLRIAKSLASENSSGAILAAGDGVVMSTSRGIELVETFDGQASVRSLIPGIPICNALAMSESFFFAASNGAVSVFRKERGDYEFLSKVDTDLSVRVLFTPIRGDGKIELIVVGQDGVSSYVNADEIGFAENWSIETALPITCADVADGLLALTSESGVIEIYRLSESDPEIITMIPSRERPRDLAIVEGRYMVVADAEGIQIFEFDLEGGAYTEFDPPNSVPSAFDLQYDPISKELLIADGTSPAKYLDFSDPEQLDVVYLIANSEGTAKLAYSDGRLYCLANNWVRTFERSAASASAHSTTQLVHSISANPNPFNSTTRITISLDSHTALPQIIEVALVNILGQTVASQQRPAYDFAASFDLNDLVGPEKHLPSGIYLCRVVAAGSLVTQKLLLLK